MRQPKTIVDAFDIQEGKIVTIENNQIVEHGYVSNVTIDNKRPEEFINVLGGQIRRRKPEETDWSADSVVLYKNLDTLQRLKDQKFSIQITMTNPLTDPAVMGAGNTSGPLEGQVLTISGCRIADSGITNSDSSTFKMSGRADYWTVEDLV